MTDRAKSRFGASICSSSIGSAPGMANTVLLAGRSFAVARNTMAAHEVLAAGVGDLGGVRLGVDLDQLRQPRRRRLGLLGADLRLVDTDPHHRAQGDDGVTVPVEQLAAVGVEASLGQPVRAVELGLDHVGLPAGLPAPTLVDQLGLAVVGPRLVDPRERPRIAQSRRSPSCLAALTAPTVMAGFSGPMPATTGLNKSLTSAPEAPTNSSGDRSFAARSGSQRGGRPLGGVGALTGVGGRGLSRARRQRHRGGQGQSGHHPPRLTAPRSGRPCRKHRSILPPQRAKTASRPRRPGEPDT